MVVAFGSAPESTMVDVIRTCDRLDCEIFFVPRLFELHHTFSGMDEVWGIPLVRLRRVRAPLTELGAEAHAGLPAGAHRRRRCSPR